MGYFFLLFTIICCFLVVYSLNNCKSEDKNLQNVEQGKASKITYQGHSYVVWSINLGGGIVHDPDCPCNNANRSP